MLDITWQCRSHASGSCRVYPRQDAAAGTLGNGVGLYFQCSDALSIYREAIARGIHPLHEPQVGNFAWEVFFADPDSYKINFSSPTDVPEEPSSLK